MSNGIEQSYAPDWILVVRRCVVSRRSSEAACVRVIGRVHTVDMPTATMFALSEGLDNLDGWESEASEFDPLVDADQRQTIPHRLDQIGRASCRERV